MIFNLYADDALIVENAERAELRGILRNRDFKLWAAFAGYTYLSIVIGQAGVVDSFDLRGNFAIVEVA